MIFSNMFNGDFLEVAGPVGIEAEFVTPLCVELGHDPLAAGLEARTELGVVLVTRLDDGLVVGRVLHRHFRCNFVLLFGAGRCLRRLSLRHLARGAGLCVRLRAQLSKVNLESRGTQAWEGTGLPAREVLVPLHRDQVLHVLVFLLAHLVARQRDEVRLVDHAVKQGHHRAQARQEGRVELGTPVLLHVEQIQLSVVDQLH